MAKKLDFKDFLTVDYAPGMDPIIKRNAKKRNARSCAAGSAVPCFKGDLNVPGPFRNTSPIRAIPALTNRCK